MHLCGFQETRRKFKTGSDSPGGKASVKQEGNWTIAYAIASATGHFGVALAVVSDFPAACANKKTTKVSAANLAVMHVAPRLLVVKLVISGFSVVVVVAHAPLLADKKAHRDWLEAFGGIMDGLPTDAPPVGPD